MASRAKGKAPSPPANPPSRTFIAIGFVAATLVTALATSGGNWLVADMQTDRNEKIATINAFVTSTQNFDKLARDFVDAFLKDPASAGDEREALQNNLLDQHVKLGAADDFLSGNALKRADLYRLILEDLDVGIREMNNAGSSTRFAQRVAEAAAERERLIADLRSAAGLPSDDYERRARGK